MLERQNLLQHLSTSSAPLTVVSAPPGYGKTEIIRQWMKEKNHIWYTATDRSRHDENLCGDLVHLLGKHQNDIGAEPHAHKPSELRRTKAIEELTTRLAQHDPGTPVVIDDFDFLIELPITSELVDAFERHALPLTLISRHRCERLSRRILYRRAFELSARELAFTYSEVRNLLAHHPPAVASHIWRVSRGWPAVCSFAAGLTARQALELGKRPAPNILADWS